MIDPKQILLGGYYYGSLPYRSWANSRRRQSGMSPICILFYHRVADQNPNGWTISNRQFKRQMLWLRDHFDMISLSEAQERIASGTNPRTSVAITFDDGYGENCDEALPLLVQLQIPCTYFVSLKFVTEGCPFPHDIAAGKPLRPNTLDQIRWMADAGIELGGHTRTHADLGRVTLGHQLHDEIAATRHELRELTGQSIPYFAFPFGKAGNMTQTAIDRVRSAGYRGACSAYGAYNFPGDGSFHLRRIHGDPEMLRLKNWLQFDVRKSEIPQPDYDFDSTPSQTDTSPALGTCGIDISATLSADCPGVIP